MKKNLMVGLFLVSGILGMNCFGQNLDNAKKMFYYERYKTAKTELENLITADAKNAEAHYWLVLTHIMQGDYANARKLATTALSATNNNSLVTVAMGHVDLAEGKKQEARSKFESAISLTDKKVLPVIWNAIGRANGTVGLSQSDPDYGIEKLKLALAKDAKNADIYINMGDCYRRKLDGGNAVVNYTDAIALNTQNARANYRIGQVYKTQDNCNSLTKYFTAATTADPDFMPAWRELFESYGDNESICFNIATARTYLEKFIATSDPGADADKIKMTFCYYSRDYNCALTEANAIGAKYGGDVATEMLMWKGYIQDKLGDSVSAFASFESFFTKKDASDIDIRIYKRVADIALKIPGKEKDAMGFYDKFLSKTQDEREKLLGFAKMAEINEKMKDNLSAAKWYKKIIDTRPVPTSADYYRYGVALYNGQDFMAAADVFKIYAEKFPTDYRGHLWAARSYAVIDSTMENGLAITNYEKLIPIVEIEPVKYKNQLMEALSYLCVYNIAVKKDKLTATGFLDKIKAVDPAYGKIPELESYLGGAKSQTPAPKQPPPPPAPGVKPPPAKPAPPVKVKPGTKPVAKTTKTVKKDTVKTTPVKKN